MADVDNTTARPEDQFFDAVVASTARGLLRIASTNHSRSFILGVGFHSPHFRLYVPLREWEKSGEYPIKPVLHPLPSAGLPVVALPDMQLIRILLRNGSTSNSRLHARDIRVIAAEGQLEMRRGYLAAVSHMDEQVGSVLSELRVLHLERRTLVIFTSDHGFAIGEGGSWGKNALLELQTRVPFILCDPTAPASHGTRSAALVELLDIVPTILDLGAGLPTEGLERLLPPPPPQTLHPNLNPPHVSPRHATPHHTTPHHDRLRRP